MKIAFLSPGNSIHTVKWVNEISFRGHEVFLITMHPPKELLNKGINCINLPFSAPAGYYLNGPILKRILNKIKPDILNTHYASGYGTLARLSGFHPSLLSVWGSDVFDFPFQSRMTLRLIRKNLEEADFIASTSHVMQKQTESILKTPKEIAVTPFGIDCKQFSPMGNNRNNEKLRIGTVKSLAPKYGISCLIEAFNLAVKKGLKNAELVLVGGGPQENELKELTINLGIDKYVSFVGAVPHSEVPRWLNSFDIYVALSQSESFGVAILEASACELPVIVSNVGGLPEVVVNRETGFIVGREDNEAAAAKILELVNNNELRSNMGHKGRNFVLKNYEWSCCVDKMECLYERIISR